jgi:hypothetical protein
MAPHVRGIFASGSSGNAWKMNDAEALTALEVVIPFALQEGLDVLVGVLRPTAAAPRRRCWTTPATPPPQEAIRAALEPVFGLRSKAEGCSAAVANAYAAVAKMRVGITSRGKF